MIDGIHTRLIGRHGRLVRPCITLSTIVAIAALAATTCPLPAAAQQDAPKRPNIVILLADDLGYADVGYQGCRDIPTPRIDALAAESVRCTNAYVSGPYCSPTRAGMLTGRYQQRFGHEFNPGKGEGDRASGLPVSETTIADLLKRAGYVTGLVGKWHLGGAPQFHPQRRGFDEFFGFLGGANSYFPVDQEPIYRGTSQVDEQEYLTDAFAREAVEFIERNRQRPFFLFLSFNAVHTPMHATEDRLERFASIDDSQRRIYAAMTAAMDEAMGRVLDKLDDASLAENTLVFFFSDNGGPTMRGTTVNASNNSPLRGSKRTTLEGGVRVPFLVRWPGKLPAGALYEHPVIQLDVLPTALAAAGIETEGQSKLDGVNLLPYLQGENKSPPHETLYWRFGEQMAIRHGDWKLVRYDAAVEGRPGDPVVGPRLYNLKDDIGEAHDLTEKMPDKARELSALYDAWASELIDPLWGARRGPSARRR